MRVFARVRWAGVAERGDVDRVDGGDVGGPFRADDEGGGAGTPQPWEITTSGYGSAPNLA